MVSFETSIWKNGTRHWSFEHSKCIFRSRSHSSGIGDPHFEPCSSMRTERNAVSTVSPQGGMLRIAKAWRRMMRCAASFCDIDIPVET